MLSVHFGSFPNFVLLESVCFVPSFAVSHLLVVLSLSQNLLLLVSQLFSKSLSLNSLLFL